jgi:hypothetical protein
VRYPRTVVAGLHLAELVCPHCIERLAVCDVVAANRNLRGHPAHGVHAAPMAGVNQKLCVRTQKSLVHRQLPPIR